MSKEFSMERYGEILKKAKNFGYWLPLVSELGLTRYPQEKRFLLIRHDIDVSVSAALEMAEIEYSMGVRSSYYIRLHCPYYNVMDAGTLRKLLMIKSYGHELGLHYESQFFEGMERNVVEGILNDVEILEKILDLKITSISQHNPSLSLVYSKLWEKYIDTYHPYFIKEIPYFGDSGRRWREGCVLDKIGQINQFHILIHPYSWTKWHENWEDNFRSHCYEARDYMLSSMEDNIQMLRNYLLKREQLDKQRENRY
ncbi:MAG: hypothetical protein HQK52_01535 [Oligoflexia bacterium]|nr:hypothetical protein [Oligoflexia bacterium]